VMEWCREHRHDPVDQQQEALNRKLRGHYQYYGRSTNFRSLLEFSFGSVREAVTFGYGEPKRARSRKRRIQPEEIPTDRSWLPLLGSRGCGCGSGGVGLQNAVWTKPLSR
jgi:hypothetical protein